MNDSVELTNINRVMRQAKFNEEEGGRVLIAKPWFDTDAYGAAVAGIQASIRLGLRSGSMGQGSEEETMVQLWGYLMKLDPGLEEIGKNCECGNHCYLIVGGTVGDYQVARAHAPNECPYQCEDCLNDAPDYLGG